MIIQIRCSATLSWKDRTNCTEAESEKEVKALEKIYRFNKFRAVPGDKKLPGPIYHDKSDEHISKIVKGIDWLIKQPRDHKYANKTINVMQGKYPG